MLSIGALTFLIGGIDALSGDCAAVKCGGGGRTLTYSCAPVGSDDAMSPGAAGGLMLLGAAAMASLAWAPLLFRSRDQAAGTRTNAGQNATFFADGSNASAPARPAATLAPRTGFQQPRLSQLSTLSVATPKPRQEVDMEALPVSFTTTLLARPEDSRGDLVSVNAVRGPRPRTVEVRVAALRKSADRRFILTDARSVYVDGLGRMTIEDVSLRVVGAEQMQAARQLVTLLRGGEALPPAPPLLGSTEDIPPAESDEHDLLAVPETGISEPPDEGPGQPVAPSMTHTEIAEQLRQLKALYEEGILTDHEYEAKRTRLVEML